MWFCSDQAVHFSPATSSAVSLTCQPNTSTKKALAFVRSHCSTFGIHPTPPYSCSNKEQPHDKEGSIKQQNPVVSGRYLLGERQYSPVFPLGLSLRINAAAGFALQHLHWTGFRWRTDQKQNFCLCKRKVTPWVI